MTEHAGRTQADAVNLVRILLRGINVALEFWSREKCDVYHCAERAWRAKQMTAPLTAVHHELRRVVPGGNLLGFNDTEGRTAKEIADLYAAAATSLYKRAGLHDFDLGRTTLVSAS